MFNNHYYNETFKRYIAIFGAIFNNIEVGNPVGSYEKVPIAFGPRDKFIERIKHDTDIRNPHVAIKLPRFSFTMGAPTFNSEEKLNKHHRTVVPGSQIEQAVNFYYTPSPYLFPFDLVLYTKNLDDTYQVLEQILPYFEPNINLKVAPLKDDPEHVVNISLSLDSFSTEDDYDGASNDRRSVITTISFTMKGYLFKKVQTASTIKHTITGIIDGGIALNTELIVNPFTATANDIYTITKILDDGGL